MAALMLVVWTSLGLLGMLFSLADQNGYLLSLLKVERERQAARSVAGLCLEMLAVRLLEDARFVPDRRHELGKSFCEYASFESRQCSGAECEGVSYGEMKKVRVRGYADEKHAGRGSLYEVEAAFLVSDDLVGGMRRAYAFETEESV